MGSRIMNCGPSMSLVRDWDKEKHYRVSQKEVSIALEQEGDCCRLVANLAEAMCGVISTDTLGMAFEPEEKFENPDGTPIVILEDIIAK